MKIKFQFYLFLVLIFLSCIKSVEEVIDETTEEPCEEISFSETVRPIIDNNCISCHDSDGNFPDLSTFDGVKANAAIVKTEVVARTMPQGTTLTQSEIDAISCWVDLGALDN